MPVSKERREWIKQHVETDNIPWWDIAELLSDLEAAEARQMPEGEATVRGEYLLEYPDARDGVVQSDPLTAKYAEERHGANVSFRTVTIITGPWRKR